MRQFASRVPAGLTGERPAPRRAWHARAAPAELERAADRFAGVIERRIGSLDLEPAQGSAEYVLARKSRADLAVIAGYDFSRIRIHADPATMIAGRAAGSRGW